ncbi:hypothetical protein O1611_g10032 [Lasiodiplodia mahajangana]|uniref:Uncharacterized protein n=1 Tax=Lasiodiplodia mahajangana TaxID=1108764 RepID=A0ACC2J2N0_9PEZI|nr:hypothetical protein O1611_g10032 [Lasiodiplodia mahajangana]
MILLQSYVRVSELEWATSRIRTIRTNLGLTNTRVASEITGFAEGEKCNQDIEGWIPETALPKIHTSFEEIMSSAYSKPGPDGEVFRPSYPDIEPDRRPYTMVSYGLPYDQACKKHVDGLLDAHRIYIIASRSLSTQTQYLAKFEATLGEKHAGTWIGVKPHTPYDDLVDIMQDIKIKQVDCLVTLGGGSLADGAKLIAYALENGVETVDDMIELSEPRLASR